MLEGDDRPAAGPICHAKDWHGEDDPDNPRNFSLLRRVSSTAAVTSLAFVSTLAASIYSPAISAVSNQYAVSEEMAILPLSLYNIGLAFGPLVGAPLSETLGRKAVCLATTPIFALFVLGSGFTQSITALAVSRFFAGAFAAPAISNASATITDYTEGRYRAVSLSFYYSIPFFGAVFGPLIGGFVVQAKSWRWTQWTTIFFVVAFYIPVLFTKETYKQTILQRRAKKLDVEGPPSHQRSPLEAVRYFATVLIMRPVHMLLTEPIVTLVCMYNGFIFGLIYTFVVASPWIYEQNYGFDPSAQSLSFLGLIIGTVTAPIPLVLIDHYYYQPRLKGFRQRQSLEHPFPPENRLFPSLIGSLTLPPTLFAFAWTTRPSVHWLCPMTFQFLTMLSSLMIYAAANLYMMDSYGPLYGASASGAAMLSRYTLSAAFPLFSLQMYEALGVGWATSILGFCTLAMAPIPWLFVKYGAVLRAKTKYETVA